MYQEAKNIWAAFALFVLSTAVFAEKTDINEIRLAGPYSTTKPLMTDTLDNEGNRIDIDNVLMDAFVKKDIWKDKETKTEIVLPATAEPQLYMAGFTLQNTGFVKGKINVKCESKHKLFVDGNEQGGDVELVPGRHEISIKLLCKGDKPDTLRVSVESEQCFEINPEGKRYWTNADMMHGERISGVELSSSAKYARIRKSITYKGGETGSKNIFIELATGKEFSLDGFQYWLPEDDLYLRCYKETEGTWCYETVDIKSGSRTPVGKYSGKGNAQLTRDLKKFLVTIDEKVPEEKNKDVHQILEPDDRQPGWRKRRNYSLYDIATGITTPITKGARNVYVTPNRDASRYLVSVYKDDLTERPFSFVDLLLLDAATGKVDTLVRHDGFIGSYRFSPDEKYIAMTGSPEALGGIGNTLPDSVIPSSYDYELFLIDLQTKERRCLTREFDPSVSSFQWSEQDGMIYALCENRDLESLYRINPKDGEAELLSLSEPFIYGSFSLAKEKPYLAYVGESSMSTDRCWLRNLKTGKEQVLCDLNPTRLKDIQLGECKDWNFKAERGDSIYGCYYLPPFFDETKQYPMLVYYYGGCSPVGRMLDSYYNYQEWAAMGYVVYVIQPSGCSGFGQEFSSRHVNAYGDYTADDIIQGTKQFCKEHPFVKADKIGCLGASYGGFMTMYLQTVTDIFAAAMSHAGISNPASYWGYGYWGYSYNTTAAAHSYPWNNMELYSGHAPLFNADKVHTPILFMHGGADTNVPINESIQMFTALKLLGRETAFITVEGENHHILNYNKRIRWHDSIMAWFAKWLKDDPTWWDTMYPKKNL